MGSLYEYLENEEEQKRRKSKSYKNEEKNRLEYIRLIDKIDRMPVKYLTVGQLKFILNNYEYNTSTLSKLRECLSRTDSYNP